MWGEGLTAQLQKGILGMGLFSVLTEVTVRAPASVSAPQTVHLKGVHFIVCSLFLNNVHGERKSKKSELIL